MSKKDFDEKLVRCWSCHRVIDVLVCEPCSCTWEKGGETAVCPYCSKCLHDHPSFDSLVIIKDRHGWHIGDLLSVSVKFVAGSAVRSKRT